MWGPPVTYAKCRTAKTPQRTYSNAFLNVLSTAFIVSVITSHPPWCVQFDRAQNAYNSDIQK